MKHSHFPSARSVFLHCACVATAIFPGVAAAAQSPVAYVYVAEDTVSSSPSSPITAYAASSEGKLTPIAGSPFAQTSGTMAGTNGSHFITLDMNNSTHEYLHVYKVASNGVIGGEVSKQDMHEWCGGENGAEFDHTGEYVYVLEDQPCGGAYLSFALSKSGELTFEGSLSDTPFYTLPVFSGNDKFAYNFAPIPGSEVPCVSNAFLGMGRESSGALENISFSETDPTPPPDYQVVQDGFATDDPANHLAALVDFQDGQCGESGETYTRLASYTIESNGDLVSTNTLDNMPPLADSINGGGTAFSRTFLLNPAGNILAVSVGTGIQFFHFNGADPITPLTGIIGTSRYISNMAWDGDNHLYALNQRSGKLHVYTATATGVVEAPGSPYEPPNVCTAGSGCFQALVVRSIP
jgi:hypothetical protein